MKATSVIVVALGIAQTGAAQELRPTPAPGTAERVIVEKMAGIPRAAVESRVTPGAPYSAEAINESTQTLADGNRITQKTVMRVYRDSEGRTRREELSEDGNVVSVSIVDPVAHVSYVLQPKTRTAYRGSMMIATPRVFERGVPPTEADKRATEAAVRARTPDRHEAGHLDTAVVPVPLPAPPPPPPPPPPGFGRASMEQVTDASKEDLGRQALEGVPASGTRTTRIIPAGAIGNLQPIKIVSEQWFSPDLQVLVLTKHSDPRTGDNTYRLQNIVRAEPDRSLFTVPADYTLSESRIRRE